MHLFMICNVLISYTLKMMPRLIILFCYSINVGWYVVGLVPFFCDGNAN